MELPLTKKTIKKEATEFRIGSIISDGMWYTVPKWRKLAKVSEDEINEWIKKNLKSKVLKQASSGAESYRFDFNEIHNWYNENDLILGDQLVDFLFPPRIWDEMTETEGFLSAPLREIGIISFSCTPLVIGEVIEALHGVAKVRELKPGTFKAYCLSAAYAKEIVAEVFEKYDFNEVGKRRIYARSVNLRRETVDFTKEFFKGLIMFYKNFGKNMVKGSMETIKIFLPDPEDQESQIIMWVIEAVEKFDEKAAVPFSGYLDHVLKLWPYNLPYDHLGKDLSAFQRKRADAIKKLKIETGEERTFTALELSNKMDLTKEEFSDLEEKHRAWSKARNATTLTWEENSDEKLATASLTGGIEEGTYPPNDIELASKISSGIIKTALNTELYDDAFKLIYQIDSSEINLSKIKEVSEDFIQELGVNLGVTGDLSEKRSD